MMMVNKQGTALISGAAGGLGRAAAQLFHRQGYQLWLTDISQSGLDELAELYPTSRISVVDLSDGSQLTEFCQEIQAFPDHLSVAFINAGIVIPGAVTDIHIDGLKQQLNINLVAACCLNQAVASVMTKQQSGHIINTLSTAAMISLPQGAAYSASKFGLRGFLLALAEELKPKSVIVSCLYPNAIDTPLLQHEAANGGSALNFLSTPLQVNDVIQVLEKALKKTGGHYFIPAGDRYLAILVGLFPRLLKWLYPVLERIGERGRAEYLETLKASKKER